MIKIFIISKVKWGFGIGDPQIIEALQNDDSIFNFIIPYLDKKECYLEFNNSAFFSAKIERDNITMFLTLGKENYAKLTKLIILYIDI